MVRLTNFLVLGTISSKLFSLLVAPFIAGPLADKIGRKWTLLASSLFFALSSILSLTTTSVGQLYAARIIQVDFDMALTVLIAFNRNCHYNRDLV